MFENIETFQINGFMSTEVLEKNSTNSNPW
jgi:hypothetical protein